MSFKKKKTLQIYKNLIFNKFSNNSFSDFSSFSLKCFLSNKLFKNIYHSYLFYSWQNPIYHNDTNFLVPYKMFIREKNLSVEFQRMRLISLLMVFVRVVNIAWQCWIIIGHLNWQWQRKQKESKRYWIKSTKNVDIFKESLIPFLPINFVRYE